MSDLETFIKYVLEEASNTETLKNYNGKIIGYIKYGSNGDQTLLNYEQKTLGYYILAQNVTTDYARKMVGRGNVLTTLLK